MYSSFFLFTSFQNGVCTHELVHANVLFWKKAKIALNPFTANILPLWYTVINDDHASARQVRPEDRSVVFRKQCLLFCTSAKLNAKYKEEYWIGHIRHNMSDVVAASRRVILWPSLSAFRNDKHLSWFSKREYYCVKKVMGRTGREDGEGGNKECLFLGGDRWVSSSFPNTLHYV